MSVSLTPTSVIPYLSDLVEEKKTFNKELFLELFEIIKNDVENIEPKIHSFFRNPSYENSALAAKIYEFAKLVLSFASVKNERQVRRLSAELGSFINQNESWAKEIKDDMKTGHLKLLISK